MSKRRIAVQVTENELRDLRHLAADEDTTPTGLLTLWMRFHLARAVGAPPAPFDVDPSSYPEAGDDEEAVYALAGQAQGRGNL